MVVFGTVLMSTFVSEVVVEWPVTLGSKIRSWKQSKAFKLACMRIHSCINEGYSQGFPWGYQQKRFRRFQDRVQRVRKGCWWQKCLDRRWALGFVLRQLPEKDAAQYPVNWGIVAGEQRILVQSYNSGPTEWHKSQILGFPGRKVDLQVQGLRDDRIGGSINESKFDRWNAICREVLSLNEYIIDEGVGRSRIHKGLQDRVRKGVGCQRECEWVRIRKSGCVKSDDFHTREFNPILGLCWVSRTAQSFFKSKLVDTDFSWSVFDTLALEEAEVDFGQSLVTCPEVPQKRQSLYGAVSPGELAFRLSWVSRKGQEWWTSSVWKWNPCSGRAWVIILLLGLRRTLAGLVVRLGRVRLLFGLVSRGSGSMSFSGYFTASFPVSCIDSLDEFPEAGKGVWLLVVDHVVFDAFGKSIVSLSAECCLTPLNVYS